jgi:hypothetical protein
MAPGIIAILLHSPIKENIMARKPYADKSPTQTHARKGKHVSGAGELNAAVDRMNNRTITAFDDKAAKVQARRRAWEKGKQQAGK